MAIPTTKSTFKDYCFRALGQGVIDINISDDQADDRIDEALQYFAQYHYMIYLLPLSFSTRWLWIT